MNREKPGKADVAGLAIRLAEHCIDSRADFPPKAGRTASVILMAWASTCFKQIGNNQLLVRQRSIFCSLIASCPQGTIPVAVCGVRVRTRLQQNFRDSTMAILRGHMERGISVLIGSGWIESRGKIET
jgi:hypothetical protein